MFKRQVPAKYQKVTTRTQKHKFLNDSLKHRELPNIVKRA